MPASTQPGGEIRQARPTGVAAKAGGQTQGSARGPGVRGPSPPDSTTASSEKKASLASSSANAPPGRREWKAHPRSTNAGKQHTRKGRMEKERAERRRALEEREQPSPTPFGKE